MEFPPTVPTSGDYSHESAVKNEQLIQHIQTFLGEEKFDYALITIASIRGDTRLRRKILKDYLIHLANHIERMKPDLILPWGWLSSEDADFAERIKSAATLLGQDFMASLIQVCCAPEFTRDRYLLHLFLEISLDGYLWTDMVELCLAMAGKDQKSHSSSRYLAITEKLCNVREIVACSPNGSIPNPFFDGVEEDEVTSAPYLRQRDMEMLFPPGNPTITVADLDREIAIGVASAGLAATGCDPSKISPKTNESLAHRLHRTAMDLRLYREALLLVKFCGIGDSASVFREFANWLTLVKTLSNDHWDNFFKEIGSFLSRMNIPDEQKVYQKGHESAEAYIERTMEVIEGSLVNLYLELGTATDLNVIVSCYVLSQSPIFPQLDRLIVEPVNFPDFLWHLMEHDAQHRYVFAYVSDWANSVAGRESIATTPVLSLSEEDDKVELAYINFSLYGALKNYFDRPDPLVRTMWATLDAALQTVNQDARYFQMNDRVVVAYSQPVEESSDGESDQGLDSHSGSSSQSMTS
ncbi:hypothetical protein BV898_17282 [Hypsibius exemplaris]|uniref:Uncharacterized protein n=1 Tax=Hypsibius exemplaris TaxID=2072580 RepID=A0A9X6NFA5_HYPEX|nr:hypothetical protein BV898_17282 [Hypsibius exemplaris]